MLTHEFLSAVTNRYQHKNNTGITLSQIAVPWSVLTEETTLFFILSSPATKFPLMVAQVLVFPCSELNSQNQFRSKRLIRQKKASSKIQDHLSYTVVHSHTKPCPSLTNSTTVLNNASIRWPEQFIEIELQLQIYCLKLQGENLRFRVINWYTTLDDIKF